MQEAIFAEKPMLVFPGFGDQPLNARRLVNNKVALPLAELTYPEVRKKLGLVLEQTRFREMKENLKKSKVLMTGLGGYEKAVEVVEEVANGTLEVIAVPKLANWVPDIHNFIIMLTSIFVIIFLLLVLGTYKLIKFLFLFTVKSKVDWFFQSKTGNAEDFETDWKLFPTEFSKSIRHFWNDNK